MVPAFKADCRGTLSTCNTDNPHSAEVFIDEDQAQMIYLKNGQYHVIASLETRWGTDEIILRVKRHDTGEVLYSCPVSSI